MTSVFDWIGEFFTFFTTIEVGGISLLYWIVFVLVLSVATFLIKGNH